MTLQQSLAFALIGGAVVLFAWGRFRYDLVALAALLAGVVLGLVPADRAFSGFTSDVVVIIASALVISAAIARSGFMEMVMRPILPRLRSAATQVPVLAGATGLLSIPTKNVGALAILMPVALQRARATGVSPAAILMPMSFVSLLGGLVTLVGTSTNIIVSQVRENTIGRPFQMFDFAPVGLVLLFLGWLFVSFAWRILPRDRQGRVPLSETVAEAPYSTEARVPEDWRADGRTIADLELGGDDVRVTALMRAGERRQTPLPDVQLRPGDRLMLEGREEALDRVFGRTVLQPASASHEVEPEEPAEELRTIEAVVQARSVLVGRSAQRLRLQQEFGVSLLAVGRGGQRIGDRLRDVVFQPGDVVVLQAGERALPAALRQLELLPLAEREVRLGSARRRFAPALILAAAMILVAFKIAPVAVGFFGAAVLIVAIGGLSLREAYAALEPEVLVLIGALTPVSEAVRETGGTGVIAHALASALQGVSPMIALLAIMVTAMACSPFLHNAPTVLVLGPISVALAQQLRLGPDAFLMAVATGAGCDFLTPIGHQCNTLVLGPGGYRFGDYWRLGLPLSVLVLAVGAPMIAHVWRLTG
jgi:di/tricarboxylate transporter